MKNKYLLLNAAVLVAIVALLIPFNKIEKERKYYPIQDSKIGKSADGAAKYLKWMKANQETGTIDIEDVQIAQQQLASMPKLKASESEWKFRGPDNVGGRTRALLIDQDNSAIMYAGGVSGGLWRSISYGQYWEQVHYSALDESKSPNLNVNCITQASNGDIYFGTGEGQGRLFNGSQNSAFIGDGVWKSTDGGKTFIQLESTVVTTTNQDFYLVYEIAADPTDPNKIYAGTAGGLKVSTDAGNSWTNVAVDEGTNLYGGYDVAVNENGLVVASIANKCYLKKPESNTFELRSGTDDNSGGNLIASSNIVRLEFAFAPSKPDYIYCIAASGNLGLRNIYQSKDGGDNWVTIGKGGSAFFNPLGDQGDYDLVIAVNQSNENIVYIGGLDLYEGRAVATGNLFDWTKLSEAYLVGFWDKSYVHADLHAIVFDKKDPKTFYIGSDGGISRGKIDFEGEPYYFKVMNKGYGVTQFYGVAANSLGHIMGGTQDNGTQVINGTGNTVMNSFEVMGGDGGHSAMSDIVPTAAFATLYYGGLTRNVDEQYRDWNSFYTTDIIDLHWAASGDYDPNSNNEGSFVTPIAYWETDNDELGTDIIEFVTRRDYAVGVEIFKSSNIFGAPIEVTISKNPDPSYPDTIGYKKGDTIHFADPYGSLFALGMARTVWVTRKAATFVNPTNNDWFRAIRLGVFEGSLNPPNAYGMETTMELAFSSDGNHLFIATNYGNLFRLSNLKHARDKATGCTKTNPDDVVTTVTKIANFGNRAVTGLAPDPNDPDKLIVTLGNYGNTKYIYYTDYATTATLSAGVVNFFDITDNLPKAPTYSAIIEYSDPNGKVYVGSELGVFVADNVFSQASSTISWSSFNEGLDPVAVYQMEQTTADSKWTTRLNADNQIVNNQGAIYIGTHGRGFFENKFHKMPVGIEDENQDDKITDGSFTFGAVVYPNPFSEYINIDYKIPSSSEVAIRLYSLSGQLLRRFNAGYQYAGIENTIQLPLSDLPVGTYIIDISAGRSHASKRIIKN